MDAIPGMLEAFPELAPGIIGGAILGSVYGFYEDRHGHDAVPLSWWQYGGVGAVVGLFILLLLREG